jgi:hypothetical protein
MPTAIAILVAVAAAAAPADLRLTSALEGLRVRAALRNVGPTPLTLTVGDRCAGPAFLLVVDGKQRPFVGPTRRCVQPRPIQRTLAPGHEYSILSDALDGRRHTVVVLFGTVASPPLSVPTDVRVDIKLAATAAVRAGQPIDLEVAHINRSPEEIEVPGCGEDRLLVDGHEQPLPLTPGVPCATTARGLKVRGAFVVRGQFTLPPGRHLLRARWRDRQSNDVTVEVAP